MRTFWTLMGVSVITCAPALAQPPAAVLSCRASDALATRTLQYLQGLVTTTDTMRRAMRDSLKLSAKRTSDVSLVTDEKTCAKAVTALDSVFGAPSAQRQVYVYKFGTDYVVEDPTVGNDSEYRGLRIFDRTWVYKRTLLTF
jgi:hypothetical protein